MGNSLLHIFISNVAFEIIDSDEQMRSEVFSWAMQIHVGTALLLLILHSISSEPRWKTVHVLVDDEVMDFPEEVTEFDGPFLKGCGHQSELGQVRRLC